MNERILIVDDEKEITDLIEVYLKNDGFTVYKFYNGSDALKCMEETDLDLAIIDVMLPDVDGFYICRKIREKFYYPIIMLTAKVADQDKIMGLTINKNSRKCFLFEKELQLTPIEFSILWYLCGHQGIVVPSEELFEAVWKEKYFNNNNTVMAHIGRLREKMKEPARNPKFIKTVWGVGYTIEK